MKHLPVELSTQLIADKIQERTGGEIRALEVLLFEGCAVVRGCTRSYYFWQLAMAACQELRLDGHGLSVDYQINVTRT